MTKIQGNCFNTSTFVILVSKNPSSFNHVLWIRTNHQNQKICIGGNSSYVFRWQSGMQYHSCICFFAVAFESVNYLIFTDVPVVFTVIMETGSPKNSFMRLLLKNQHFENVQKQLKRSVKIAWLILIFLESKIYQ